MHSAVRCRATRATHSLVRRGRPQKPVIPGRAVSRLACSRHRPRLEMQTWAQMLSPRTLIPADTRQMLQISCQKQNRRELAFKRHTRIAKGYLSKAQQDHSTSTSSAAVTRVAASRAQRCTDRSSEQNATVCPSGANLTDRACRGALLVSCRCGCPRRSCGAPRRGAGWGGVSCGLIIHSSQDRAESSRPRASADGQYPLRA